MVELLLLPVLGLVLLLGALGPLGAILMPRTPLASRSRPSTKRE
jgi:hypothetical protein